MEFGSGEPVTVSGTHHDGADSHTDVVDIHSRTSSAEITILTAPHNVSGPRNLVFQVPNEVVNVHTLSHETDCNAAKSGDNEGNPGCSVSPISASSISERPLTTAYVDSH